MEDFNQNNGDLQKRCQIEAINFWTTSRCLGTSVADEEKLEHSVINKVAAVFHISRLSVSWIWHTSQAQCREGKICADISSKKKEKEKITLKNWMR